ncbi:MAG: TerB family tellurite resistance protein [Calditrichaceae bacterium]
MKDCAVLFLEMGYIDFNLGPEEEKSISKTLVDLFQLEQDQVQELIRIAWQERKDKSDIWTFAGLIKEHFTHDQKIKILEKLWLVIFADGKVDKFEDRLIRKISSLLGLEHGDMIAAKLKIKKQLNIE